MSERRIRIGGVMRCCLESIARYEGPEVPGETVIGCIYHNDPTEPSVRLAMDGVWEWVGSPALANSPAAPERSEP